ncbi:monosaccharide ABC transporter ATP-binding protein [Sanguibacter keddieii DSM 10542]|uniref:Monosaccharide ABC transporter ATP-binding protein n=1 Tax=Sanguibacter keddieii (strain ATCC 51767 / DSM 10542 / NCFB 3025 / ST-74) TaxID=446469 RepID=D1BB00_SANKS|nr:ATP-binding cassette domain-containing protein [Sanguibacter keddieii]ACZ22701.1 monosaccharide ABC transporter ATP-binding protein [Sanguibacter keddieii DSM 10542]
MTTARPIPALSLRGIDKSFGAVKALSSIDLDIYPGEVVALVGDNAAGKSTIAKVIAGVITPDAGIIESDGVPVTIPSPTSAHALGITTVFQELALVENLDIVSNLYLGRELRRGSMLLESEMEEVARQVLRDLTIRVPSVRTLVADLSGGQRQAVAIARTLLGHPRIVVLDEPTASLSVSSTAEVLTLIERLRDLGHGVVLISHNMGDVRAVADRIEVLRHGRNNGSFAARTVSYEDIIAAITGAVDFSNRR